MRVNQSTFNSSASFIKLKDDDFLERLRIAGKCVSEIMSMLETLVKEKANLSMIEIDKFVEAEIEKRRCIPTFRGYKGFPNSVCISINKALVHGVCTDYRLQEGDKVSFDFGATFHGAIADSAATFIYGEPKSKEHVRMIETTKKCLSNAIDAISVGKRLGVIGDTIYKTSRNDGFRVIETHGGHGISENEPHDQPFVSNRANPNEGIHIQDGLVIAIEPLLVPYNCGIKTRVGTDQWTTYTEEIGSHEEHTIFVHNDHVEIITAR